MSLENGKLVKKSFITGPCSANILKAKQEIEAGRTPGEMFITCIPHRTETEAFCRLHGVDKLVHLPQPQRSLLRFTVHAIEMTSGDERHFQLVVVMKSGIRLALAYDSHERTGTLTEVVE